MKGILTLFLLLMFSSSLAYSKKGPKIIYPSKTTVTALDPVLSWKYSNTPHVIFEIKIAEDPDYTQNVISMRTPLRTLKLSYPYLKPGQTYYWTVRALHGQTTQIGATDWAHKGKKDMMNFMFKVSDKPSGDVGYFPLIVTPENGSEINSIKPVFKWTFNHHENTVYTILNRNNEWVSPLLVYVTYRLEISKSEDFSEIFKSFELKNDSTTLSITVPAIQAGNTYLWRVKAIYADPVKLQLVESYWSYGFDDKGVASSFSTNPNSREVYGFNEGQQEEVVDPFRLASVERITIGPWNYFSPAVSMDGSKLAYCSDKDKVTEIYIKNLDEKYGSGETKKTISTKGVSNYNPFWLYNNEEVGFFSNRYSSESLWEIFSTTKGTGTSVTFQTNRLEMEETKASFNLFGSCSIDGKMVFTAKSVNNPLYRLLLKDFKDNSITDLRPGMFPNISNDDRIIFAADEKQDGNYEIMIAELEGHSLNNPAVLASHEAADYDPAISPDGSRILFTSNRSGNSDVWVMNTMGTDLRQLTFHPMADRRPQWINNETIVFQSNRIVNDNSIPTWNIYKMAVPKN